MAGIRRLVETSQLKTKRLENVGKQTPILRYNKRFDALLILVVPPERETVVHYVDQQVGLVYEAETLEILGVQIEAFERRFLKQHEGLENAWRLSNTGMQVKDLGDMILVIEQSKEKFTEFAQEVVHATSDILGTSAEKFAEALELA